METLSDTLKKNGSYILYGVSCDQTVTHVINIIGHNKNNPDTKIIDLIDNKKSIGIAQIKEGLAFLREKPLVSTKKVLVVNNADKATDDAQNSMLKILEEPQKHSQIILIAQHLNDILDTVQSRCIKIDQRNKNSQVTPESNSSVKDEHLKFDTVLEMGIGKRFEIAEELSKEEKPDIIKQLQSWIQQERQRLGTNPQAAKNIRMIEQVSQDLSNLNIGTRLALENLFLSLEN